MRYPAFLREKGKPIEQTINECNELIKFQKIIKLSSKYKEVWYGTGVYSKVDDGTTKVTSIEGDLLKERNECYEKVFTTR